MPDFKCKYCNEVYLNKPFAPMCTKCQKGKKEKCLPYVAAPVALDCLTMNVDQLMNEFVIEQHQWKHYEGGESGAAQFTGMTWQNVHKMICQGVRLGITSHKGTKNNNNFPDIFVTVTGMKASWNAGNKYSDQLTNSFYVQVAISARNFSAHAYPDVNPKTAGKITVNMANNAWTGVALTSDNNSQRIKAVVGR